MPLTLEQQEAVDMVKKHKISILTGPPGVGKTFTLKKILKWAKADSMSVIMASPTGKAAKQMYTATGYPASTIHRMLKPKINFKGEFEFRLNESNKLSIDLLIIDEVSMVTNSLMASILKALNIHKTKILLVGDHYQLPAVGVGAILRDMIKSGVVPFKELTQIQRNSGDIVKACHKIKNGENYKPSVQLFPKEGLNLRHISRASTTAIKSMIKRIVCDRMPARGYDPVWDVQVLSPTNKNTDLSCQSINEMLQSELNKENPPIDKSIFRVNDKVIQTKNKNFTDTRTGAEVLVVNGDMGKVLDIIEEKKQIVVEFYDPKRIVTMPLVRNKLLLAYCITCHRMQGSEAPVVVIPFHNSFNFFLTRQWVYTAISRAKDICITIGHQDAADKAITVDTINDRRTYLTEKIKGVCNYG